jgi:hypothetical protein
MKYGICGLLIMATGMVMADTVKKVSVELSVNELQALVATLQDYVEKRAPRTDAATIDSPSYPVVSSDAADLQLIISSLCSLRLALTAVLGTVTDPGSCFPTITTIADIDNATLDVIAWLKTLMREFRGVCP